MRVEDQEMVLWLIENHLLMSDIAFKNDPQDPDVIASFTSIANTPEKINSLFLFTLCDIAAVGPNILNEWRISLLRSLLYNSRDFLQRGLDTVSYSSAVQDSIKTNVLRNVDKSMNSFIQKNMSELPPLFWEAFSSRMIIDICKFYKNYSDNRKSIEVKFLNYENNEYSAIVVICKNRSGILKDIVKGLSFSQINILGSRVISLNNNDVIDVFWICNSAQKALKEKNEQNRLVQNLIDSVEGLEIEAVSDLLNIKSKLEVLPKITVDNKMSKNVTTYQILSGDRKGLLMDILNIFHKNHVSVQSAKISTYGEKIFDTFQITDIKNKKIKDANLIKSLEKQLIKIL